MSSGRARLLPAGTYQNAQTPDTLYAARTLVLRYGWNAMVYQILNPGMLHWFSPEGDAVIGYVKVQGYRVVAGAPVCSLERLVGVAARFEAEAKQMGQRVCYFGVQERFRSVLETQTQTPLAQLLLGAQPIWQPMNWSERVARKGSLRAQMARARNKRVTVQLWSALRATNDPELRHCRDEWLCNRRMPPMSFLIEPDTLGNLSDRKVFVAEQAGKVIGFLLASPVPLRNGWLIEQIIRRRNAPNGTAELLLDTAMRELHMLNAEYVTLGLSPLSHRAGYAQSPQPGWLRLLLAWVRAHGCRFYNFEGLDAFKAKFLPEAWEPVYLITRERQISPRTVHAVAEAFSATTPALFLGHILLRALAQEIRSEQGLLRRKLWGTSDHSG